MTREDRPDLLRSGERLVNWHARSAGIRENYFYPLPLQASDEDLGAVHEFAPVRGLTGFGRFGGRGRIHIKRAQDYTERLVAEQTESTYGVGGCQLPVAGY